MEDVVEGEGDEGGEKDEKDEKDVACECEADEGPNDVACDDEEGPKGLKMAELELGAEDGLKGSPSKSTWESPSSLHSERSSSKAVRIYYQPKSDSSKGRLNLPLGSIPSRMYVLFEGKFFILTDRYMSAHKTKKTKLKTHW